MTDMVEGRPLVSANRQGEAPGPTSVMEDAVKRTFPSARAGIVLLALGGSLPGGVLHGQTGPQAGSSAPVTFTAEQDQQNMMQQLGIKAHRVAVPLRRSIT